MALLEDMNGSVLTPGSVVWCEGVIGYPGEAMLAEVLDCPAGEGILDMASHGKVKAAECVWVRQMATAAVPLPEGVAPWETRWPAAKTMLTRVSLIGCRKGDPCLSPNPA